MCEKSRHRVSNTPITWPLCRLSVERYASAAEECSQEATQCNVLNDKRIVVTNGQLQKLVEDAVRLEDGLDVKLLIDIGFLNP